jgi:antirestriction protein ArdC
MEALRTVSTPNSEDDHLHISVNDFILKTRDNLVNIHMDGSGVAHYDAKKDTVYMPHEKDFESYKDYVNELMRQVVSATGHVQRLARGSMSQRIHLQKMRVSRNA